VQEIKYIVFYLSEEQTPKAATCDIVGNDVEVPLSSAYPMIILMFG
jgi:hypothetical protein